MYLFADSYRFMQEDQTIENIASRQVHDSKLSEQVCSLPEIKEEAIEIKSEPLNVADAQPENVDSSGDDQGKGMD